MVQYDAIWHAAMAHRIMKCSLAQHGLTCCYMMPGNAMRYASQSLWRTGIGDEFTVRQGIGDLAASFVPSQWTQLEKDFCGPEALAKLLCDLPWF